MAYRAPTNSVPSQPVEDLGLREQVDSTAPFVEDEEMGATPAETAAEGVISDAEALKIAAEAYTTSTDYIDTNFRKQWETHLRYFDSRHAADSKYYKDAYKHRSKIFRPKARMISRRVEALAANAFFSNQQRIKVGALNSDDPKSVATANMMRNLLHYRLKNTLPWFLTVVGGIQDAAKTGVVCSYNYWCYKTKGEPGADVVLEDKPKIELTPVEHIRISPNAKWDDPINSSPYVGRMVPMYLNEIRAKMDRPDRSGRAWRAYTDAEIMQYGALDQFDSTRQTRIGKRTDPIDSTSEVKGYGIAWAIEWFIEIDNQRVVYWTLGKDKILSTPENIEDVYLHGKIPITMGYCVVETHKPFPNGLIGISAPTQRELNSSANNRADNVALVLNKQYAIKAGQQVDTTNLMYGVPGGVTAFQNPQTDIVPLEWNDVTQSSYQEEDRRNVDFDELVGNFSAGSVMTNRRLNETVGGMEILGEGAATLSEYTIRTFVETWMLPTLTQLMLLEQYYETDATILALAAKNAQNAYRPSRGYAGQEQEQAPSEDDMVAHLIDNLMIVEIDVGMNATDPNAQITRLLTAVRSVAQASKDLPPAANTAEIAKEVFQILGYGDGSRFWDADEQYKQLLAQAQQQAQEITGQAQEIAKALIENADKRRRLAESAEHAAMEEQQQLLREINKLMERAFAQAMREIKTDNEIEKAELAFKLSKEQARNQAKPKAA